MDNTVFKFLAFDAQNFLEFILRFVFNFVMIVVIASGIYFKFRKRRNILFALYLINLVVFFVCYLLQSVQISIGFAFGIFAIFSILRYRTSTVPIKEMTYLFVAISLAIINALTNISTGYGIMLFTNAVLIIFTYLVEKKFIQNESSKIIIYEKIDLIKPENHAKLFEDLSHRTGLKIHRFEIGRIDFMRDTAQIRIFYSGSDYTETGEFDSPEND